jgi:hypothetical protein
VLRSINIAKSKRRAIPETENLFKNQQRNHGRNMLLGFFFIAWKHVSERFDRNAVGEAGAVVAVSAFGSTWRRASSQV